MGGGYTSLLLFGKNLFSKWISEQPNGPGEPKKYLRIAETLFFPILKIFLNFDHFLNFWDPVYEFCWCKKCLLGPRAIVKNHLMVKKCRFFKVGDTLTIIIPREKKHLNDVYTSLKWFWDNLRRICDRLKKSICWTYLFHNMNEYVHFGSKVY